MRVRQAASRERAWRRTRDAPGGTRRRAVITTRAFRASRAPQRHACVYALRGSLSDTHTARASGAAMEMITLPGTSLRVSRICLGTQQFSNNWEWPME